MYISYVVILQLLKFSTIMTNRLYRDWEKCFHLRPISKLHDASSSNVCGRSCGVVRCTSGQDPAHERADEMSPWGASYSSSWSIPISRRCLSLSRMPPKTTNTCYMAHFGQSIPEEQIRKWSECEKPLNLCRNPWVKPVYKGLRKRMAKTACYLFLGILINKIKANKQKNKWTITLTLRHTDTFPRSQKFVVKLICDLMKGRIAKNALSRISTMKLIKSGFMDLLGGKYILSAENPWVVLNMKDIGFL